jgi:hypothetical protein
MYFALSVARTMAGGITCGETISGIIKAQVLSGKKITRPDEGSPDVFSNRLAQRFGILAQVG